MQTLNNKIICKVIPIGFSGEPKQTLGEVSLVVFAEGINTKTKFQVIDAPSAYNVIRGKPWIYAIKGVPLTYHQLIKLSTPWRV